MKEKIIKWFNAIITFLKGVDNLYLKFILTVIAFALVYLCFGLEDVVNELEHIARNLPDTFDGYISGSVSVD
jgi:hypothetical protein